MKVVFMGTPEFAVPTLSQIVAGGHQVVAVYTRAPRPAGRGQGVRKSPVHQAAQGLNLPVFTPKNFKDEADRTVFAAHGADAGVVAAYGLLLPKPVLDAPARGCLNLHGSALPRWRGAAPIQRAIMAGDKTTAAMVMQMDEGLDTGPIAMSEEIVIGPDMTGGELHDKMMEQGASLMVRALSALDRGALTFTPQCAEGVTYAKKINKIETRINWTRPALEVHNLIRALSPFPGAWFESELSGKTVRVKALRSTLAGGPGAPGTVLDDRLTIACGQGAVRILEIQRAGKSVVTTQEFVRGTGSLKGTRAD